MFCDNECPSMTSTIHTSKMMQIANIGRHFVAALLLVSTVTAVKPSTAVLELNEKFLEISNEGQWLMEFYAPWCGHCKQLAPIWEQVAHELIGGDVKVGKIDCTRFTSVASALDIRGFPTIKFFKNGQVIDYDGERTKEALVDFARKAGGPSVRPIASLAAFNAVATKHEKEVFFVIVRDNDAVAEASELEQSVGQAADAMFTKSFFYAAAEASVPHHHIIGPRPLLLVFKDGGVVAYQGTSDAPTVKRWIAAARWPRLPVLSHGTLKDMGTCCDRLVVLVVSDLLQKAHPRTTVARLHDLVDRVAGEHMHTALEDKYLFGWLDGPAIASSIVLGAMSTPSLMVFNYTTYEYYLPDDAPEHMTAHSLLIFLQQTMNGERAARGGRGVQQRIKRVVYEVYSTLHNMFASQPLLTCCLFGLPAAILAIICYSLCSADFSVEHDDVYPDTEDDDSGQESDDHEKVE